MNDLVLLGSLAAGWYLFLRDTAPAEPVPVASPPLFYGGLTFGEQPLEKQWPDYATHASGAPLPTSAQKPELPDQPIAGYFKATVVAPRPPPSLSNRTSRVSNT